MLASAGKQRVKWGVRSVVFLLFCAYAAFVYPAVKPHGSAVSPSVDSNKATNRRLLGTDAPTAPTPPTDAPTTTPLDNLEDYLLSVPGSLGAEEIRSGYWVLFLIGVIYMFIALAIVCDEWFVPALEVMVDVFDISNDVAGATFMAAGGSAPELFTSFVGTFSGDSTVGFGTIVGSAVFNVLFVIGACVLASKEILTLTWWPLFRDCTFYAISLIILTIFFGVTTPEEIDLYEAVILFLMYIGYVILMMYNQNIYAALLQTRCFPERSRQAGKELAAQLAEMKAAKAEKKRKRLAAEEVEMQTATANEKEPTVTSTEEAAATGDKNLLVVDDDAPAKEASGDVEVAEQKRKNSLRRKESMRRKSSFQGEKRTPFRAGFLQILVGEKSLERQAGIHVVYELAGDVEETFKKIDANNSGYIEKDELSLMLEALGSQPNEALVGDVLAAIDTDNDGKINLEEFTSWYIRSETRILDELRSAFEEADSDHDGQINQDEVKAILVMMDTGDVTEELTASVIKALDTTGDGCVTKDEFLEWYKHSDLWAKRKERNMAEADEVEGVTLWPPPKTVGGRIAYGLTLPLVAAMYVTMPDVRKPRWRAWFPYTFIISIIWIGIFSYLMVWWGTVTAFTFNIDTKVFGVTVLAAGTSVPDLLSSVIVAMHGQGDMAVSSSIGSNIFDILVGLPLPWILFSLIVQGGGPVSVIADGLLTSLVVLFLMIIFIITVIACVGWKLSKPLAAIFFLGYAVFLTQDLLFSYGVITL
jgi:K+-dependent Na+/Ca+ exchanger-like protein